MEFIYIIDFIILPAKKIDKDNLADVADEKLDDDVDYVVDNFVAVDNDDSKHCFVDYPNNFDCIVVLIMIDVHVAEWDEEEEDFKQHHDFMMTMKMMNRLRFEFSLGGREKGGSKCERANTTHVNFIGPII
ncbi:hypothetical protein PV325_011757 [Microctonus aethiopoides]|nr:hypothetical protein PV325_011757 [Microctonus aethiopoides]